MVSDAKSTPIAHTRVTAVIPVEDRGRHELLRLAAGLGAYLRPEYGEAIEAAARSEDIAPAHVETVMICDVGQGAVARVEGRHLALGRYGYLVQLGLVPKPAEVHVARHIEATGNVALYLMVVEDGHCLGILGVEIR
jgi:cation transport ATPase